MKKLVTTIGIFLIIAMSGCGNFSPRNSQELEDINGQIQEMEEISNSINTEVGNLQTQSEIQNSKLDKIQQGLANFQNVNENSGVQILSGTGGLIAFGVLALMFIASVLVMSIYMKQAETYKKTSNILAKNIAKKKDVELENKIFIESLQTKTDGVMLNLIKKHQ